MTALTVALAAVLAPSATALAPFAIALPALTAALLIAPKKPPTPSAAELAALPAPLKALNNANKATAIAVTNLTQQTANEAVVKAVELAAVTNQNPNSLTTQAGNLAVGAVGDLAAGNLNGAV